jgi:methylenetetrahydrofolate dehydrogenase (NADP+) / methenyltetrahydrofolate cyclohydrolase
MQIIDGRKFSKEILKQITIEVAKLPFRPVFCDVLVGGDAASAQYVRMKAKTAEKVGFRFRQADYPADVATTDLIAEIKRISQEPDMCGLIVQLPLPSALDKTAVLNAIDPAIDVDCIGQTNSERFYAGRPYMVFPTAAACLALLDSAGQDSRGKKIVVVGQGELVGKPVKFLLEQRGLEVETIRSKTPNPEEILRSADVIVSAAGQPGLITADKIKPGAIIIDAGTAESDGGIVGDVDTVSVSGVAGYLSPVPGGVGPVTVAMLMSNVLTVARQKGV